MSAILSTLNDSTPRTGTFNFLRPPEAEEELGRLGPYVIRRVLGTGGMGIVFEAVDRNLARVVALKVLRPEAAAERDNHQRFTQEARSVAGLQCDHIVSIYHVGEENGVPFFAMPVLAGESLQTYLDRTAKPDLSFMLTVARETALGLAAAHEIGIIHRDIKPGNLWLEADRTGGQFRRTKVLDFGLARSLKENTTLTASGIVMGTPNFMAPEQASKRPLDHRADLFSLGCVMYRMITGALPFDGNTALDVLMAIVSEEPPAVSYRDPSIPWPITDLVTRLLDKDPFFRPNSALDVAQELQAILAQLPPPVFPGELGRDTTRSPQPQQPQQPLSLHTPRETATAKVPIDPTTGLQEASTPPELDSTDHQTPMTKSAVESIRQVVSQLPAQSTPQSSLPSSKPVSQISQISSKPIHFRLSGGNTAVTKPQRRWPISGALLLLAFSALIVLATAVVYLSRNPVPIVNTPPPATTSSAEPIKIGVLHSLQGTMSVSEQPVVDATILALEEINNRGGVLGRPLKVLTVDGRSDPIEFAKVAETLYNDEKVAVVFGCWTSASRKAVRDVVQRHNGLLFYPVQYEGLEQSPRIVYTGPAPNQQILPAADYLVQNLKAKRIFLVGSDYVFPRSAHAIISDRIGQQGKDAKIVGDRCLPLGTNDWSKVVDEMAVAKPDAIINTINGSSAFAFYHQWRTREAELGYPRAPILSVSLAENEFAGIPIAECQGDYLAASYFQAITTPSSREFTSKLQRQYGRDRGVTDMMAAAYEGVHIWAMAAERAGSIDPNYVLAKVRGLSFVGPRGTVSIDPETLHATLPFRIAQFQPDGQLKLLPTSEQPIRAEPFPKSRTEKDWNLFLNQLRIQWNGQWNAPIAKPN